MTRILSLGQNNGLTLMILNLAPVRSYHLDTLSSLNFANRTKKIEVCEVENEPMYRHVVKPLAATTSISGANITRQPLRPLTAAHNANLGDRDVEKEKKPGEKPVKAFSVYSDARKPTSRASNLPSQNQGVRRTETHKRPADTVSSFGSRPTKVFRQNDNTSRSRSAVAQEPAMSKESIEALISQRIDEKLAEKALQDATAAAPALSAELQRRLDDLEQRIDAKEDDGKSQGLQFLLMAKQHQVRGEDASALRMYSMALPFFPGNEKLRNKMRTLEERIKAKREAESGSKRLASAPAPTFSLSAAPSSLTLMSLAAPAKGEKKLSKPKPVADVVSEDEEYAPHPDSDNDASYASDASFRYKPKAARKPKKTTKKLPIFRDSVDAPPAGQTPRTAHLLKIINSKDVSKIRLLKGVGAKKADAIVNCLVEMEEDEVRDLESLAMLKGVGGKTVENMRAGLAVEYDF
jgi:DNA uptake protein ComE-like DNA-binding protein